MKTKIVDRGRCVGCKNCELACVAACPSGCLKVAEGAEAVVYTS